MTVIVSSDRVAELPLARGTDGGIPDPPYPGIRPFEQSEWPIFFGRQPIVEELLARLSRDHFVAVIGASGGGKSSLVKAGLFATLQHKHKRLGVHWCTVTMRPAGSPMWSLAEALYRALHPSDGASDAPTTIDAVTPIRAGLARGRHAIAAVLREHDFPAELNLLLLVDQFEELFRYSMLGGDAEVEIFLDQLVDLVESPPESLYLILTMRSDFLGDCAQYPRFADLLNRSSYLLRRMTTAELSEAIEHPAALLDGTVTAPLVERLLQDARGAEDQLPLLQHTMMRLWQREPRHYASDPASTGPPILDPSDYETVGGMAGALSQHANEILERLETSSGSRQVRRNALRIAAKRLFQALVQVGPNGQLVRRPQRFKTLVAETGIAEEDLCAVIEAFRAPGRSFLMPPVPKPIADETLIDIAHEALIRQWDKIRGEGAAKGWQREELEDVASWRRLASHTSSFIRNPKRLLDSEELVELRAFWDRRAPSVEWLDRYCDMVEGPPEPALAAGWTSQLSQKTGQLFQQSQRRQRLRQIAATLVVVSLIATGGIFGYLDLSRRSAEVTAAREADLRAKANSAQALAESRLAEVLSAQKAEKRANLAAAIDRARLLAKRAMETIDREGPTTGLLLALEGLTSSVGLPQLPQTEAAAYSALNQQREAFRLVFSVPFGAVALSPNGRQLLTGSDDGTAWLWDVSSGVALHSLTGHKGPVAAVAFSPDGQQLLTGSEDGTTRLWDAARGSILGFLAGDAGSVASVAFSPDGRQLLTGSQDGTTRLWDAGSLRLLRILVGAGSDYRSMAMFSSDGRQILIASGAGGDAPFGGIRLVDAANGESLHTIQIPHIMAAALRACE